jgi:hypothetical protein
VRYKTKVENLIDNSINTLENIERMIENNALTKDELEHHLKLLTNLLTSTKDLVTKETEGLN